MSVVCFLWIAGIICAIVSFATGKVPVQVALVLYGVAGLLTCWPR